MSTSDVRVFIPITKVDAKQRLVYGTMTAEAVDSSGEIWDYEGSKPYFEAWTENAQKTSGGKSLGNLRSMHQPIAAGKLTQLVLDDEAKSVEIAAKVVDDAEWAKVEEGVYTGFSQGGRYVRRWKDEDDPSKTRYISDPVEVSLVDLPCLPTATFEYIKSDGAHEIRKFTTRETSVEPTNEEVAARATEMAKAAGDESAWASHVEAAREALIAERVTKGSNEEQEAEVAQDEEEGDKAPEEDEGETKKPKDKKAARESLVQVWRTPDGEHFSKAADAVAHILGEEGAPPLSPVQAALKAARGEADTAEATVRPVPTEGLDVARGVLGTMVEKGLYTAGASLSVLDQIISLQCSSAWEAEWEGDGSGVPAMLAEAANALGAAALAMCQEEIAEALAGMETGEDEVEMFEMAAQAEMVKSIRADEALMEKAGARNSKKDAETIQKMHDGAVALGAKCDMGKTEETDDLAKLSESSPAVRALVDERDALKAQVAEAVTGIEELGADMRKMREEMAAMRLTPAPLPPNAIVVDKAADATGGTPRADIEKASALVAELSKTQEGQRMLAEAAIRAQQMATTPGQ